MHIISERRCLASVMHSVVSMALDPQSWLWQRRRAGRHRHPAEVQHGAIRPGKGRLSHRPLSEREAQDSGGVCGLWGGRRSPFTTWRLGLISTPSLATPSLINSIRASTLIWKIMGPIELLWLSFSMLKVWKLCEQQQKASVIMMRPEIVTLKCATVGSGSSSLLQSPRRLWYCYKRMAVLRCHDNLKCDGTFDFLSPK